MYVFSLLGDSNVKRHLNILNCRDKPHMSSAELKLCGSIDIFSGTLRSIRSESNACIVACITNFLTSSEPDSSASTSQRVEPVLREVHEVLLSFCEEQPERAWLLAPPMYRTTPQWYNDGLSQIMIKFSAIFRADKPKNLHLLPTFSSPCLEVDGVHLTPYSGFEYVVSLFDSAVESLNNLKRPVPVLLSNQAESVRSLEDRVTVIEADHKRLSRSVESKAALQAEANDFAENQRFASYYDSTQLLIKYVSTPT